METPVEANKAWDNLTEAEKIERMRRIVKQQREEINTLREAHYRLQCKFNTHEHDQKGLVLRNDENFIPFGQGSYETSYF